MPTSEMRECPPAHAAKELARRLRDIFGHSRTDDELAAMALVEQADLITVLLRQAHEAAAEIRALREVVERVLDAVKESSDGDILGTDAATWNPDAHIEITITASEVFAIQAALSAQAITTKE